MACLKTWQGTPPSISSLMSFAVDSNYLLLRGQITDRGMEWLVGLEGLFALNLVTHGLSITAAGLQSLAALPNLEWLGFDANDDTMPHIAALPHLRDMLDVSGYVRRRCRLHRAQPLANARIHLGPSLLQPDGARLHGKASRACLLFVASRRRVRTWMRAPSRRCPTFRGWGVHADGCPRFRFSPCGPVRTVGSRVVYVLPDTTDVASKLSHRPETPADVLRRATRITDRSLEILSGMDSLERWSCQHAGASTDGGVARSSPQYCLNYANSVSRACPPSRGRHSRPFPAGSN